MDLLELTGIAANLCIIVISTWLVTRYLKLKKYVSKYMANDIDKIIDSIEELEQGAGPAVEHGVGTALQQGAVCNPALQQGAGCNPAVETHKERLIAVAASGNAKLYLGKNITTTEIESLEDKEVLKLYSRYETYIGNVMTKSLKSTICGAYTTILSALVPSVSKGKYMLIEGERLSESLIENPVINLALSTYTCKLYHNYGHYLAPLTAGLLTSGHVKATNPPSEPQKEETNPIEAEPKLPDDVKQ